MKKEWVTWLSLLVLCLGTILDISQGYTVLAESLSSDDTVLIQTDDLLVSSKVTPTETGNDWVIHYRLQAVKNGDKRRLKFQFLNPQGQPISVAQNKGWKSSKDNQIIGTFRAKDEGDFKLTTDRSVSKISLKIQADAKNTSGSVQTDILSQDIGKTYELAAPEDKDTSASSSSQTDTAKQSTTTDQSSSDQKADANETVNNSSTAAISTFSQPVVRSRMMLAAQLTTGSTITPQYTTDATGTYPTNSWIPTGNQTVINHQGNVNASNQWDGNKSWDGNPSNRTSSYIEYGGSGKDAQYAIRKYAKETTTPGLYDVYLNVRGNEQKDIKPVDIVLVVDMSGSMEPGNNPTKSNRAQAARDGVSSFLQEIQKSGIGDYVNVGLIGFSSPGYLSTKTGIVKVDMQPVSTAGHVNTINSSLKQTFTGGTFTQAGIRNGTEMLQKDTSSNEKFVILLTDGVPTFTYKVTSAINSNNVVYGTSFSSNRDEPSYTSQLWGYNNRGNQVASSYYASNQLIRDTWPATLGEAKITKDKGVSLHALGIQLDKDTGYQQNSNNPYLTKNDVLNRMITLASPGLYQTADTAADIQKYLQDRANKVISGFKTVNEGSISDPLGKQFLYNGSNVDVKSVGDTAVTNLPKASISNNQLDVSGLTLGSGQEVQLHYQVRLNTETNDFNPNYWYQMNGRTTLTPNINTPDYKVDFGIPSAKGEGVSLNLKKIWEEYDGDKSSRPNQVTYGITRKNTVTTNAWQKGFATIQGTADKDTWTTSVSKLAQDATSPPSLSLPKYNANGVAFNYSVSEESAVNGYDATKVDDVTFKNKKQFKPLNLQVTKTDSTGKNVAGANFKLKNSKGTEFTVNVDATGAIFTFNNLVADKYTLTETKAPDGYVILSQPISIEVLSDGTVKQDGKLITAENYIIKITVKNQQKGMLPSTGGSGRTGYFIASIIFMALIAIIGAFYYYRNKRSNNKRKLFKLPFKKSHLIVLLLSTSLGITLLNSQKIAADEQPITFILHKRVFKDSENLPTVKNDGLAISSKSQNTDAIDPDKTYGLNGVTFDVYDVTDYAYEKMKSMSTEDLLKHVANTEKADLLSEIKPYQPTSQEIVTTTLDGEDGVASVTVNPTSQNSAYLILEKQVADKDVGKVKMTATPMLVVLPVKDPIKSDTFLSTIHLYPKNTAIKKITTPPVKPKPPHVPPLPETGEVKSVMTILGSIAVVVAVSFWYKRRKYTS